MGVTANVEAPGYEHLLHIIFVLFQFYLDTERLTWKA